MSGGMIKTTVREIKLSFGRYMAIFAIVMLGVGFYTGLKATTPAMILTENDYLLEQDFFDFRLLSTLGFDEDSAEKLKEFSEISDAEGAVSVDALCALGTGSENVYKFHTVPERINRVVVTVGRMPEKADECVLDAARYGEDAIGTQITVTDNNGEDTLEMFRERTFTAVGIVRSPYYINFERGTTSIGEGKVTAFIYVPREAFDCDYLTELYATTKLKYSVYTEEYIEYIDGLQDKMEEESSLLATARYNRIIGEAQEKIDDAQRELDDKEAEAREELATAWQKIIDGEEEIADGERKIADAVRKIADGKAEIAEHEQELADGEQEIADGEQEIAEHVQEIADAEEEINYAEWKLLVSEQELNEARRKLDAGEAELESKERELLAKEKELRAKKAELSAAREYLLAQIAGMGENGTVSGSDPTAADGTEEIKKELEMKLAQVEEGLAQVEEGLAQIAGGKSQIEHGKDKIASNAGIIARGEKDLEEGKRQLEDAKKELADGKEKLEEAKAELADGIRELEDGRVKLEQAKTDLAEAERDLAKGKADLEEGKKEVEDGKTEYAEAEAEFEEEVQEAQLKIDDAREELADVEEPEEYVLTRETNIGYACYESDSNIVAAIAGVFPVFFFLVAALICMTTMNRMVEEQRIQIGVLKALGYSNAAIMGKYLFYAGSAAMAGAAAGCAGGTWLFPKVIWMGYGIMYSMGDIRYYFDVKAVLSSLAAALLCSVGAAYFSCRHELNIAPAALIRPRAPKSGKRIFLERITFIWRRMRFLHKVSVRNIIRYKKRFFMMILGISGCTALLLTGFGVKDSIAGVADMQYDEIQIYDIGIILSDKAKAAGRMELEAQTEEILDRITWRFEESVDLDFNGKTKSVYLEVPQEAERIGDFVDLHTTGGERIEYPGAGEAVLTEKAAETLGIKIGDQVTFRDTDMNTFSVTVTALSENFVSNYLHISAETYEAAVKREPDYRSAYAVVKEGVDVHEAAALISDIDDVLSVSPTDDMRERIGTMMESMDYIVLLIIVCAGSLAFIVLYNLTNINITERIREIATIKVLGFYGKETADYVFRENLVLTGMGAIAGLGLGRWLHWFVMYNIKIDMISFRTTIAPVSFVLSLLLTFVFAMFVNGIMYFKLEKINMAEALKSVE